MPFLLKVVQGDLTQPLGIIFDNTSYMSIGHIYARPFISQHTKTKHEH